MADLRNKCPKCNKTVYMPEKAIGKVGVTALVSRARLLLVS